MKMNQYSNFWGTWLIWRRYRQKPLDVRSYVYVLVYTILETSVPEIAILTMNFTFICTKNSTYKFLFKEASDITRNEK